jgi:Family of unknown function (DUF5684)
MDEYGYYSTATIPVWVYILCGVLGLITIIGGWKAFAKAGQPGWAFIIPFYNYYVMCKIGGKPGWWFMLIIFLPFIFYIWVLNMISKSFGKDVGFTLGLLFLGFIFWPILGFGSAKYLGPYGDPEAFRAYQGKDKFDFENKK